MKIVFFFNRFYDKNLLGVIDEVVADIVPVFALVV